jgi:hypothetical protein
MRPKLKNLSENNQLKQRIIQFDLLKLNFFYRFIRYLNLDIFVLALLEFFIYLPQILMLRGRNPCCDFNVYHAPEMIQSGAGLFQYLHNIYPYSKFWSGSAGNYLLDPMTGALSPLWLAFSFFTNSFLSAGVMLVSYSLVQIILIAISIYYLFLELGISRLSALSASALLANTPFVVGYFIGPVHLSGILCVCLGLIGLLKINAGITKVGYIFLAISVIVGAYGYQFYISVILPLIAASLWIALNLKVNVRHFISLNISYLVVSFIALTPFLIAGQFTYSNSYRANNFSDINWTVSNIPAIFDYIKMLVSITNITYIQNISSGENQFLSSLIICFVITILVIYRYRVLKAIDIVIIFMLFSFSVKTFSPLIWLLYLVWPFYPQFRAAHYIHFAAIFFMITILACRVSQRNLVPCNLKYLLTFGYLLIGALIFILLFLERAYLPYWATYVFPICGVYLGYTYGHKRYFYSFLMVIALSAAIANRGATIVSQDIDLEKVLSSSQIISKEIKGAGYLDKCNIYAEFSNVYRYTSKISGVRSIYSYDPLPKNFNQNESNFYKESLQELVKNNIQFIVAGEPSFPSSIYYDLIYSNGNNLPMKYEGYFIHFSGPIFIFKIKPDYLNLLSCVSKKNISSRDSSEKIGIKEKIIRYFDRIGLYPYALIFPSVLIFIYCFILGINRADSVRTR